VFPCGCLTCGADEPSPGVACVEASTSILSWDTWLNNVNHQVIVIAISASCGSVGNRMTASHLPDRDQSDRPRATPLAQRPFHRTCPVPTRSRRLRARTSWRDCSFSGW
jgi:hypothetical protein